MELPTIHAIAVSLRLLTTFYIDYWNIRSIRREIHHALLLKPALQFYNGTNEVAIVDGTTFPELSLATTIASNDLRYLKINK